MLAVLPLMLQAKYVKFAVDMTGQVIDSNGVHITGDFQAVAGYAGGDWMPNTTLMTNEPNTNIYSVVVNIPAFAKYEYKFINGDATYALEFVPEESRVGFNFDDNRWIYVDSLSNDTMAVAPVLFSGNAPIGKYLLRFKVDMQHEASVSISGVHVAGDIQGWDPLTTQLYSFDGNVYEYIAYVDTGMSSFAHEFKYVNGNAASQYEMISGGCANGSGNREVQVPKDTVLPIICFAYCSDCLTSGIDEQAVANAIHLYPNPAGASTQLVFDDQIRRHDIFLRDVTGRVISSWKNYAESNLRIDTGNLGAGVYLVSTGTGTTIRLIVQ